MRAARSGGVSVWTMGARWRRARAGAVGLVLASALVAGACRAPPAPAFGSGLRRVPASAGVQRQERAMFERLNRDRKARGLPPLRFDERLAEVARHHSADMRDNGFFEHESPRTGGVESRLDAAGYPFITARENLSEAPDIERSQAGLLKSPPHHANIMAEDVTHVGIGIVEGGVVEPSNLTVTQVFARPAESEPPARARVRALERLDRARRGRGHPPARRDERLMALAQEQLAGLDEQASPSSVERAGDAVARALAGPEAGSVAISAQIVPTSEQIAFPDALLDARECAVGLALRRVEGERGRPALQLLLLGRVPSKP